MFVGESSTGKTSFISYLINNRRIPTNHYPTVGVEAGIKEFEYEIAEDGKQEYAVVELWDTAGKHSFHDEVCEKFYANMDGFIIFIDKSNENTLKSVAYWTESTRSLMVRNQKKPREERLRDRSDRQQGRFRARVRA